ncbi:trichohyalin-like isoform X2 [Acanthaster planci]|uniref:Trichohyalin-like isoform X2 n=1 Tax=Acanthaster planci TaxID=133434 RepID=A0A8B7YW60_ACAPL|nr:trichohyalin-like isoform X2 [Acanthaster planci]
MGTKEDFEAIFDLLDPTCRGFVDANQLQEFHKAFHYTSINADQIDAAISQVCSGGNRCPKFCFLDVLLELERRRTVEERAWWDFQALDSRGNHRITPREALILMKATHQEHFTTQTWQAFLKSRDVSANEDVTFNEIRMWLCNPPLQSGEEWEMEDITAEGEKLDREKRTLDYQEHKEFLVLQEDELSQTVDAQDRQYYQNKFRSKAKRKLNRWVNLGVEALIFDDGKDYEVDYRMRNRVTVQDLLEALEQKYDILREKLLWEAVKKHIGDPIWSSMSEGEQQEQVLRVQMKEHQLRRSSDLDQISRLVISYQHYDSRLEAMIGCLRSEFERQSMDHQSKVAVLLNEGKTEDQIYEIFANEYAQRVQGVTTCGQLLIDLHKRYMKEREFLLSVLKMGNRRALTSAEMITEYASLAAQQLIASYEGESFEYSSMATGLAERPQQYMCPGFDSDRDLNELLALERLHRMKGRRPPKVIDDDGHLIGKNRGIVAWQVEVVRQLLKKHSHECEVMIYLLQGKESATWLSVARRKSQEHREDRLKALRLQRSNWRQGSKEHLVSKRTVHLKILLEGTGLYHENRRTEIRGGHNFTDNQVSACVLADLQQKQAQEVEKVVVEMQTMTADILKELWRREHRSRTEEWLDNVSAVILSTIELTEEDKELVEALEAKYDVLREKILTDQLMREFGESQWLMMSEQERQRLLIKKKMEERQLRREGKMDELARLISGADKDSKHLQKLMGKNREEYEKQLAARLARRERRRAMGLDSDESDESDSEEAGTTAGHNLLLDLQSRYNEDMDALMALLRRQQGNEMSERERQALLLRLRREKRRAAMEDNFDEAALLLGLAERNKLNMEERMKADRERQLLLARERLGNRQRRRTEGKEEIGNHEELSVPAEGDINGWRETVLKELDRKHILERELLLTILTDEGSEELRDAARQMVQKARQERLQELKEEAEKLNPDKKEEKEGHRDILEEAGAIKSILRTISLTTKRHGQKVEMDEVHASILADLQEEQERESEVVMAGLVSMSEEELSKMRIKQIWEVKMGIGKNVLNVFTQYEGAAEDDAILKALDKKYDALKDKLLIDILRSHLGEKEWARMKEQDRQKKLLDLRQEERRLRKEGKMDALAALLGNHAKTQADLKKLMGDSRTDYQEKLKMRIERRKKKIAEGGNLDDIEEELSEEEGDSQDSSSKGSSPLEDLQRRYDSEREAILMRLNSSEAEYMSEKERQAELIRLRLELRKARGEDNFIAAALVMGLAERNQATTSQRLKHDRQRQESLAKQRIEAMRRKRALGTIQEETEDTVTDNDDRNSMQDAVIRTLEKKHNLERETLYDLLHAKYGEDEILIAEHMTQEQRQDILQELMERRRAMDVGKKQENQVILSEASIVKMAGRKKILEKETTRTSISKDDVVVTIMADLQQQQARECEALLSQLPDKDFESLVHVQQQNIQDQKNERNENVAVVVMTADLSKKAGEEELVDALQGKFDALKDKILTEALMKQIGEAEWAVLSEKERQVRLVKLRLEERRLRQEGKYDEAAALLGDAIASQTALELLLGDTKKQQEDKLKERLEKRRLRVAQGMTEEEINQLEWKEIEQEEEELRKKTPKNILEDLDNRLDAERDALLAGLRDANDCLRSEKERQLELVRLRREQRKARKEEKFDAAALAMGLAKQAQDAEDQREKERQRQMQLAKERLAQCRKTKEDRRRAKETTGPIPMPEDEQSEVMMQEAVIQEMEVKHEQERDVLIELMQDQEKSSLRTNARQMTEDNRQKKLKELQGARQEWRDSRPSKENEEEQIDIFSKATALTMESLLDEARQTQGDGITDNEIQIALLADLQQQQEQEARRLMEDLGSKTLTTLKQLKQVQYIARANGWNDNVAGTVLVTKSDSSEVTEEQLLKALEVKYDTLRDKLLSEALMKQMGEVEWARLSERERQGKLMKLKLQERKMRQEGKYDEAAALLGQGLKDQQELTKLLGNTKAEQGERLKQRLERRRQLIEKRAKEGLAVDDETLDAIIDKEEKRRDLMEDRKKRRNILEELNSHFEDERDQLLAALRNQDASLKTERERQLALAKLRRDQRKLQLEDKFDTAALIFGMAQQQEQARESNLKKDKERQKQLARERITNLRKKKAAAQSVQDTTPATFSTPVTTTTGVLSQEDLVKKLRQEEEENAKVDAVISTQKDVGVTLHTTILDEIEKKHGMERDLLLELVELAQSNKHEVSRVEQLTEQELMNELKIGNQSWQECELQLVNFGNGSSNLDAVAELQHQKRQALKSAILLRMEDYRRTLTIKTKLTSEEITDEVLVSLLAELQLKQSSENKALNKILSFDEDPEMLETDNELIKQLISSQRKARRELQLKNLEAVVFGGLAAIKEEDEKQLEAESKEEETKMMQELEKEIEQEKQELQEKVNAMKATGENVDPSALLAELEAQHAAKRKTMQDQLQRQRRLMRSRLAERRQKQEDKEYEEDAAMALIQNAEHIQNKRDQDAQMMKEKQTSLMKDRLAQRREKRHQAEMAKEEEERKKKEAEEAKKTKDAAAERLPPGLGMQREKTVIDVSVSEEKKKALFDTLVREHTKAQLKIEMEQEKQTQQLKERIQQRKNRYQDAATMLLGLGERQKTMVAKSQKEERDRQLTMVKERIEKVRYERTQTMKLKKDLNAKTFKDMMEPDRDSGLSKDEKMAQVAANMQRKFMEDEQEIKKGTKRLMRYSHVEATAAPMALKINVPTIRTVAPDDDNDHPDGTIAAPSLPGQSQIDQPLQASRKLGERERTMMMKEKMAKKRKNRRSSLVAAPDMESLSQMIKEQKEETPATLAEELTLS